LDVFGLFGGPTGEFESLLQDLDNLSNYAFTAIGTVTFVGDAPPHHVPVGFSMEGAHATGTGQFSAVLQYLDAYGQTMYRTNLLEVGNDAYISVVPLFQRMMDVKYIVHGADSVAEIFEGEGEPYLRYPDAAFSALLPDVPALVASLNAEAVQEALITDQGIFTMTMPNVSLSIEQIRSFVGPFGLLSDLHTLATLSEDSVPAEDVVSPDLIVTRLTAPFVQGASTNYTLEFTFTHDEELGTFTSWLTLSLPGEMTVTVDVTYQALHVDAVVTPDYVVDTIQLQKSMAEFHDAQARRASVRESGLEFFHDLPELHMVNHRLDETDLLEHYDMEIDGEIFQVSVMSGTTATSTEDTVFSWAPSLSIFYRALPAYSASETITPFILEDLDPELDHDAENFHQTAMRLNAQDTAAATSLHFDDNLVGRTVHIYVLQNLEGTEMALFLRIVVILENMTPHGSEVLEQLGLQIGLDFQEYLDIAIAADPPEAEPTETEE